MNNIQILTGNYKMALNRAKLVQTGSARVF